MDSEQILDMITTNREFIQLKSNIALQNLAMLHRSFDHIDSEECKIALALNDSNAAWVFSSDYAKALSISLQILDTYAASPYPYLLACHETIAGRSYTYALKYDLARDYLLRAQARIANLTLEPTEEVRGQQADILHDMAMNNHRADGDKNETITYLDRALTVLEPTGLLTRKGICLMGIGNVRQSESQNEEALRYYMQAETLFQEADNMGNLATVFCNIGICHTVLKQFDEAESYLLRSLDIRQRLSSYWVIGNSYYNLGMLYLAKGEVEKAYDTLLISRDYALLSQTKGLKLLILRELKSVALLRGDESAATQHQTDYDEIDRAEG